MHLGPFRFVASSPLPSRLDGAPHSCMDKFRHLDAREFSVEPSFAIGRVFASREKLAYLHAGCCKYVRRAHPLSHGLVAPIPISVPLLGHVLIDGFRAATPPRLCASAHLSPRESGNLYSR